MEGFDRDQRPRLAARRTLGKIFALCAVLVLPSFSDAGQAKSAEEVWKALENLPAAEREKKREDSSATRSSSRSIRRSGSCAP
jgi:hypothetical protein